MHHIKAAYIAPYGSDKAPLSEETPYCR